MPDFNFNTFDFMITEENDVMLLLYARNTAPENPAVQLNYDEHNIVLTRNKDDVLTLENVEDTIFDNIQDDNTLLVCEIEPSDNEEEAEIVYTYEADIVD